MPAGVTTLGAIRAQAQQRCDLVNSNFITTAEWNSYINGSYYELYDLLVQKFGDDYFVTGPTTITTDGVNNTFALPVDFYKLLGVDGQLTPGTFQQFVNVPKFNFTDRNRWTIVGSTAPYPAARVHYRLLGNNIFLEPTPSAGALFRIWYVPRLAALVNDTDTVDGVSGWEEYIIVDACIKAMVKEESDPSAFGMQKQALVQRIEAAAENRDAGNPATVVDSQGAAADPWGSLYEVW